MGFYRRYQKLVKCYADGSWVVPFQFMQGQLINRVESEDLEDCQVSNWADQPWFENGTIILIRDIPTTSGELYYANLAFLDKFYNNGQSLPSVRTPIQIRGNHPTEYNGKDGFYCVENNGDYIYTKLPPNIENGDWCFYAYQAGSINDENGNSNLIPNKIKINKPFHIRPNKAVPNNANVCFIFGFIYINQRLTRNEVNYITVEGMENVILSEGPNQLGYLDFPSKELAVVEGWNTSNVKDMFKMFASCSTLSTLNLSGWNTSNVTDMSYMFSKCTSLESLILGEGWDTSNVTNMASMFSNCTSYPSFDFVANWDTSKLMSVNYMFRDTNIENLDLSSWNTSHLEKAYGLFYDCKHLKSVNLTGWDMSENENVDNMFYGCLELTEVAGIEDWEFTKVDVSVYQTFMNCRSLTGALDLSKWKIKGISSASRTFSHTNLSSLNLSTWTLKEVGVVTLYLIQMFGDMQNLTSLDVSGFDMTYLNNKVNGTGMFYNCNKLAKIKCKQSFKDWCLANAENIELPAQMRSGGSGTWEIVN